MARLQIGDRIVEVDDSFLSMSPADQQSTVDEIEAALDGAVAAPQANDFRAPPAAPAVKSDLATPLPAADLNPPPERSLGRTAGLGARAVARGVGADILGAPGDMREMNDYVGTTAVNAATGAVNDYVSPLIEELVAWAGAQKPDIPDIPEMPVGVISDVLKYIPGWNGPTSDEIANATESAGKEIGIDLPTPETTGEKLFSNIMRYGSQAVAGGVGMAKSAAGMTAREAPGILKPYLKTPVRAVIGDAGGGAGVGGALTAVDEYAPDSGPLATLIAALGGGVAGKGLVTVGSAPKRFAEAAKDRLAAPSILRSDEGVTPNRKSANQAAAHLQGMVSDKDAAIADLEEALRFIDEAGGTMPTTGMASESVGLRQLEKQTALTNPGKFAERYEAVAKDASNDAKTLQIPGADKEAPKRAAMGEINAAQGNVNAQKGQLAATLRQVADDLETANTAETNIADAYRPFAGKADDASMALDKAVVDDTLRPMQREKNQNFEAIDPDGTVQRDITPLIELARTIKNDAAGMPPSLKSRVLPEPLLRDIERMGPQIEEKVTPTGILDPQGKPLTRTSQENVGGSGKMSFKGLNDMRPALQAAESEARAAQQYPLADNLRAIRQYIGDDSARLADEGGEAGARAQKALTSYEEDFAPLFAQGEGKNLRKAVNTDDLNRTKTPPTKTASRFLKEGAGGREAAADLQRIIEATPDPAQAKEAARRYVLSDMNSVIGANGKISETSLQKWINQRQGMLSQIPELDTEVNALLADVRAAKANTATTRAGGNKAKNRMWEELEGAKRTQKDIENSALGLYMGRNPDKAIAAAINSGDPVTSIKEIRASFKGDAAAEEGFKAAAADHFVNLITASDGEKVTFAKISQAFKKSEGAMVEIFGDDVKYLRQAQTRLKMLTGKNVQAVAGSGTVENAGLISKLMKPYEVIVRMMFGALRGGSEVRKAKLMAEQLPDGTKAANELVMRAALDPRVAKHLLAMPLKEVGTPRWNNQLNRLMGWAAAARESGEQPDQEADSDEGE